MVEQSEHLKCNDCIRGHSWLSNRGIWLQQHCRATGAAPLVHSVLCRRTDAAHAHSTAAHAVSSCSTAAGNAAIKSSGTPFSSISVEGTRSSSQQVTQPVFQGQPKHTNPPTPPFKHT
mmetsp:Transcript_24811/g.67601  ORF Transcript_24811/g.67601 Transcript_24811/m.67601 type:complete len:118 (+) Transcript_24811:134-487(+)